MIAFPFHVADPLESLILWSFRSCVNRDDCRTYVDLKVHHVAAILAQEGSKHQRRG